MHMNKHLGGALPRMSPSLLLAAVFASVAVGLVCSPVVAASAGRWKRMPLKIAHVVSESCPSRSFCVAVGGKGYAVTFTGRSWSDAHMIDPWFDARGIEYPGTTSVSCPSSSFCMTVDGGGGAVKFNGRFWGRRAIIDPPTGPVPPNLPNSLTSVSCT